MCQPRLELGPSGVDIRSVYRVLYGDEVRSCPELVEALWGTVSSWDADKQRQFLKFVTGVDTLPSPGVEVRGCGVVWCGLV